ncbi:MAG: branched-chain amino acid ABC transporter permease [Candidatus Rokubacteria bacterium]|nr:branched-chain amino acid ABC transporter permease [Candidatus Rokubacteria bacterium]
METASVLIRLLPQQLVNGITIGAVYALIALGYTMVYGVLQLINFAHGDLFMLGAMIAVFLLAAMAFSSPLPLGLVLLALVVVCVTSMAIVAGLGVVIERVAYKPLRTAGRLSPLISALGVSVFLENATMNVVGPAPRFFPDILPTTEIPFFGIMIQDRQLLILVVATGLMVWLHYLVNHTVFGLAVRATAEDKDAASLMGVDVDRVIAMVFVIGPALGAAAGMLFAMLYGVVLWNMGFLAGMKAFTAAVLGGIGNIPGAVLGGLMLGLVETFGAGYLPIITGGLIGPEYKDIFAFCILILVLVFRPMGILGERVAR